MGTNKNLIVAISIFLGVFVIALAFYFIVLPKLTVDPNKLASVTQPTRELVAPETLGAQVHELSQALVSSNLPSGNPLSGVNPIKDVYKNPFDF